MITPLQFTEAIPRLEKHLRCQFSRLPPYGPYFDVDDLVQDGLLAAWEARKRASKRQNWLGYLKVTALNGAVGTMQRARAITRGGKGRDFHRDGIRFCDVFECAETLPAPILPSRIYEAREIGARLVTLIKFRPAIYEGLKYWFRPITERCDRGYRNRRAKYCRVLAAKMLRLELPIY